MKIKAYFKTIGKRAAFGENLGILMIVLSMVLSFMITGSVYAQSVMFTGQGSILEDSSPACEWDAEPDGDVDGKDLGVFIDSLDIGGGEEFNFGGIADEFGRADCSTDTENELFSPPFTLSPDGTVIDTPADVVFSVGLDTSIGTPIAVDLLEVDAQGAELNVLGNLVDNGDPASGDVFANDRIFSYLANLQSSSETTSYYRARISYDPGDGVITLLSRISSFLVYPDLTDERFQEIHDQIIWAADQLRALKDTMPLSEASAQMAEILNNHPAYTNVGIAGGGEGVYWTTVDGYPCFAIIHPDENVSRTSALPIASFSASLEESHDGANVAQRFMQTNGANDKPVGNRKVLILDPFFDDMDDVDFLFRNGPGPDYEVDYLIGSACDLEAFKRMKDYGIVIISSHGQIYRQRNVDRTYDVYICTRQPFNLASKDLYKLDLKQGRLSSCSIDIGDGVNIVTWSIRPGFVSKYCQGMPDSLVYVSSCYSLKNRTMADAFLGVGAKVYYGVTGVTRASWEDPTPLVTRMLNGENSLDVYSPLFDPEKPEVIFKMAGGGYDPNTDPISITMGTYEVMPISFPSIDDGWPAEVLKSRATDINNNGEVCGQWWPQPANTRPRGFYWNTRSDPPQVEDLGVFIGTPELVPEAINDDGIIVGKSVFGGFPAPIRWNPEADPKLSTVSLGEPRPYPGGQHLASFSDVNNVGQITGSITYYLKGSPYLHTRAFLYSSPGFLDLGTLSHDPLDSRPSHGFGINNTGTVVGSSQNAAGNTRAFFYAGGMVGLPIPAEFNNSTATAINSFGMVVGGAWGNPKSAAGYWDPYLQFHGLAHVTNGDGWPRSEALDVNDKYTILGKSVLPDSANYAYVIWTREDGETYATKLSSLVDWPGWHYIVEGASINNDGQIAATANRGFGTTDHAVILTKRD